MRALVLLCLTASIVSGIGGAAQMAAPPSSGGSASTGTTLKVTTRLTLVDVTVTDSKGQPVTGLTESDFNIKEDGKPQPIKNFEELGSGRQAAAPDLPPGVFTNRPGPSAQTVNILLLDQVTLGLTKDLDFRGTALKDAKDAALKYVEAMPEGTRVAVLDIDGSGLHAVQAVTSDRELLRGAIHSIAYKRVTESIWDPPQSPAVAGLPPEKPNFLMLCNAMNFQSSQALNALNQASLLFANIPGRKNVMWFTLGVPWLTNYPAYSRSQNLICISDFTRQLQAVYGRLTAERVALYPINPVGVWVERNVAGTNDALEDLAKATGGKAHFDNDLFGALRDDTAAGAHYYALSYVPPLSKYDGKYHTIEVKVNRPGLQLEYRRGYTSLDLNGPLLDTAKSHGKPLPSKDSFHTAMGYGSPLATQLTFAVRAATVPQDAKGTAISGSLNPELKGKPLVRYSFAFDLPRNKITLQQQPDGSQKGTFEVAVVAYDVQGRVLNSLDEKRSFVLKPAMVAGFLQKPFLVSLEVDLPAGNTSVRAGVLDLPSGELGVIEIPLKVANASAAQ